MTKTGLVNLYGSFPVKIFGTDVKYLAVVLRTDHDRDTMKSHKKGGSRMEEQLEMTRQRGDMFCTGTQTEPLVQETRL